MMRLTLEVQSRDTTQTVPLQVVSNLGDPLPPTRAVTVWKEKGEVDAVFTQSFSFLEPKTAPQLY